jgi:hypothetical protein
MKISNQPAFSAQINKTPRAVEMGRNMNEKAQDAIKSLFGRTIVEDRDVRLDFYTKRRGNGEVLRASLVNTKDSRVARDIAENTDKHELLQWYENAVSFLTNTFG